MTEEVALSIHPTAAKRHPKMRWSDQMKHWNLTGKWELWQEKSKTKIEFDLRHDLKTGAIEGNGPKSIRTVVFSTVVIAGVVWMGMAPANAAPPMSGMSNTNFQVVTVENVGYRRRYYRRYGYPYPFYPYAYGYYVPPAAYVYPPAIGHVPPPEGDYADAPPSEGDYGDEGDYADAPPSEGDYGDEGDYADAPPPEGY